MKKILLFFILYVFVQKVYTQEKHYFYRGEQIILETDLNTIVLFFKAQYAYLNDSSTFSGDNTIEELDASDGTEDIQFARITYQSAQQDIYAKLQEYNLDSTHLEMYSYGYVNNNGRVWPINEVMVKYTEGTTTETDAILANHNAVLIEQDAYGVFTYKVSNSDMGFELSNELVQSGNVEFAEPDFYQDMQILQDPLYPEQYYLNNTGQIIDGSAGVIDMDIDGPEAWAITAGSSSIKVAVIDDGVERDPTHEDLPNVASGFTPDCLFNCDGRPRGCHEHGQAVAGIIGAAHNNLGVRGISPDVTLVPFRIFKCDSKGNIKGKGNGDIAKAINKAWDDFDCDVLSNSWGMNNPANIVTHAIYRALINGRNGKGSIVVFAAGNSGGSVSYPGNLTGVLAISALGKNGSIASYSSRGNEIAVSAFGGSLVNDITDIRTTDRTGDNGYNLSGNYTNTFGKTSAACPQVSGIASLLLSRNSNLTGREVSCRIRAEAIDLGNFNRDDDYGSGKANAHLTIAYDIMIMKDKTFTGFQRFCTNDKIETQTNVIIKSGANVSFRAANQIKGTPGFHAEPGSTAHAFISSEDPFCDCNECVLSPLVTPGSNIIVTACANTNYELCFTFKNATNFSVTAKNTLSQQVYNNSGSIVNDMACFNVPSLASGTYFFSFNISSSSCGVSINNIEYTLVLTHSTGCRTSQDESPNLTKITNPEFIIYPNPASGIFTFKLKENARGEVYIYNPLGQIVYHQSTNPPIHHLTIDLSSHPKGIYFIKVQSGENIYIEKIVLQ